MYHVSSKKRGKRDQWWYLSSHRVSISSPRLHPSLASLIPLFPRLSQENYNLTAHFNISASKWVWQALLWVVLSLPHFLHVSLTSLHPPTPLSFCPNLLLSFAYCSPDGSTFTMWQERKRERETEKTQKQIRLKARPLCQAIRLSHCEFHDTYTTMNLQWGEVSLRPDVRHSHSGLDAHRQCLGVTDRVVISSTETDMDSKYRCVCMSLCVCVLEVTAYTWATSAHEFF